MCLKYPNSPVWLGGDVNLPDIDWTTDSIAETAITTISIIVSSVAVTTVAFSRLLTSQPDLRTCSMYLLQTVHP